MLSECHGHIILDGLTYTGAIERHQHAVDDDFVRSNLKTCSESGVSFYRDGGDKHMVSLRAKAIAAEYGIDYRTPVYIIHKSGFYGSMFGRAFDDTHGYRGLVREVKRLGGDFIKLTASGLLDFANDGAVNGPEMAFGELDEMIKIAHGEGFAIMIHANGADNIKRAAEAGADSIEHGFYIDCGALSVLAQTGAVWVPTCATVSNLIGSGRYDDSMLRRILDGHLEMVKIARDTGVTVACGSDAGASLVAQGSGTRDEMRLINTAGLDPAEGNRRIAEVFKKGYY